jgi:hypothetical protein
LKQKIIIIILLSIFLNGYSQTEKQVCGKVVFNEMPLGKIDIVNLNSKLSSTTDDLGNFCIKAKIGDVLFILSNEYYDIKISLKKDDFIKELLIISLTKKPIELDEVAVTKAQKVGFKVSPEEIALAKLDKFENAPKVVGVYSGEMPYGMDFVGIFKKIFRNNNKEKKETPRFTNFKEYVLSKFDSNEFFNKKLNIKPDELDLFIAFCESDTHSKTIMLHEDILETIEFLMAKNKAFQKLER